MFKLKQLLAPLAVLVLVIGLGCRQQISDKPSASGTDVGQAAGTGSPAADVAQVVLGSVEMGKSIGPDGVSASGTTFRQGDPLFVSVETEYISPGTTLKIEWQGPRGDTVDVEQITVPQEATLINLKARDTSEWTPGSYRLAVAVGGASVGSKSFAITAAG